MIAVDYQIAYREVLEILKHIPVNDYKKIPESRLRLFEKYAKKDIVFHYNTNQTLDEQNVSEKAKILIAILFRDYWANSEQKEKILACEEIYKEKIEEEKREKYNRENLFKNNTFQKEEQKEKNSQMIEYKKESLFRKMINKLKKLLLREQ